MPLEVDLRAKNYAKFKREVKDAAKEIRELEKANEKVASADNKVSTSEKNKSTATEKATKRIREQTREIKRQTAATQKQTVADQKGISATEKIMRISRSAGRIGGGFGQLFSGTAESLEGGNTAANMGLKGLGKGLLAIGVAATAASLAVRAYTGYLERQNQLIEAQIRGEYERNKVIKEATIVQGQQAVATQKSLAGVQAGLAIGTGQIDQRQIQRVSRRLGVSGPDATTFLRTLEQVGVKGSDNLEVALVNMQGIFDKGAGDFQTALKLLVQNIENFGKVSPSGTIRPRTFIEAQLESERTGRGAARFLTEEAFLLGGARGTNVRGAGTSQRSALARLEEARRAGTAGERGALQSLFATQTGEAIAKASAEAFAQAADPVAKALEKLEEPIKMQIKTTEAQIAAQGKLITAVTNLTSRIGVGASTTLTDQLTQQRAFLRQ